MEVYKLKKTDVILEGKDLSSLGIPNYKKRRDEGEMNIDILIDTFGYDEMFEVLENSGVSNKLIEFEEISENGNHVKNIIYDTHYKSTTIESGGPLRFPYDSDGNCFYGDNEKIDEIIRNNCPNLSKVIEMSKLYKTYLEITKSGLPAIWETGGGMTNTGNAFIIADSKGEKKKSLYVRRRGHLSCGPHALVKVDVGDWFIDANHHHKDFIIKLYKVKEVRPIKNKRGWKALIELVSVFSENEWSDNPPPDFLKDAIHAAVSKATTYHCRTPFYVIEPDPPKF